MELPELSELYHQFEIPEFEEWKNKVTSGLKQEVAKPFASNYIPSAPRHHKQHSLETGAVLMVDDDAAEVNKALLFLLSQGIQAIEISFKSEVNSSHLAALLEDVTVEYIHIFWNVDSSVKVVIEDYWKTNHLEESRHTFIQSAMYIQGTLDHLQQAVGVLKPEEKVYIELTIGTEYIKEVAKLRAVHTMLAEIGRQEYCLVAKFMPSLALDNDTRMIANTIMALAAMVGGCTYAFPYNQPTESDAVRLASNIIQILKFESKLELLSDPLSGSYLVEELTQSYLITQN